MIENLKQLNLTNATADSLEQEATKEESISKRRREGKHIAKAKI